MTLKIFFYRIFDSIAFRLCSKNKSEKQLTRWDPIWGLFSSFRETGCNFQKDEKNYSTSDVIARKIHAFYIIDVHTHSSSLSKCNWPKKFDSCENSRFVKKNNGNKKWGNQIERIERSVKWQCQMTPQSSSHSFSLILFWKSLIPVNSKATPLNL